MLESQVKINSLLNIHTYESIYWNYLYHTDSSSSCVTPSVTNGQVESNIDNGNTFLGRVKCDSGYELFGEKIIKCRNGVWSADLPLCTSKCTVVK